MNSMQVYPGWTSLPYNGLKEGRQISLSDADRRASAETFPENILSSGATVSTNSVSLRYRKESVSITINGVFPNYPQLNAITLKRGRFINERDMEERRKVIILHEKTADILFPKTEPLGKRIESQGVSYQVVGIYADQNSFQPSALAPFTTIQLVYQKGDSIDNITFTTQGLTDEATNTAFEQDLRCLLGDRKQFDPTDNSAIWIWNRLTQYRSEEHTSELQSQR